MTQGIALLCINNPHYGYFAANMALSLKAVNKDIPIQIIHEPHALSYLKPEYLRLFDEFTRIDTDDILLNGKISPAKAKLSLYKYFAFDETIYFDVDGLAIKDLSGLFEDCKELDFATQVHGKASIHEDEFKQNQWADMNTVREYYPFPSDATIPATNTSFFYVRKSVFAATVFERALENISQPIPLDRIKTWGAGQPDELYMNITLAQLGYIPELQNPHPVYLRSRKAHGENATLEQLKNNHYAIGVYGDYNYNHHSVINFYKSLHKVYSLTVLDRMPEYKLEPLMQHKWVRNKR